MVTRSGVGSTRITLSDCGTKDSKLEDTRANTTDVNPCLSLIRSHSTSPAARVLRESHKSRGIDIAKTKARKPLDPRAGEPVRVKASNTVRLKVSPAQEDGLKSHFVPSTPSTLQKVARAFADAPELLGLAALLTLLSRPPGFLPRHTAPTAGHGWRPRAPSVPRSLRNAYICRPRRRNYPHDATSSLPRRPRK
jgi:hypothetical protein